MSSVDPFLCKGITLAVFQVLGNLSSLILKLQSLTMLSVIYGANNFKNLALISSKPVALEVFILQRYLYTKP